MHLLLFHKFYKISASKQPPWVNSKSVGNGQQVTSGQIAGLRFPTLNLLDQTEADTGLLCQLLLGHPTCSPVPLNIRDMSPMTIHLTSDQGADGTVSIFSGTVFILSPHDHSHAFENSASEKSSASPVICLRRRTSSGSIPSSRPIFASDQLRLESSRTISLMAATWCLPRARL